MPKPRLPELEKRLLDTIRERRLPVGAELPPSRELTRQLETNRSLLSKITHGLIGRGILERRGYKLYLAAQPKAEERGRRLHLYCLTVLPTRSLSGVRREAAAQGIGFTVRALPTWTGPEGSLEALFQATQIKDCDGIVFHSPAADSPAFLALQEEYARRGVPIICAEFGSRRFPGAYPDRLSGLEMCLKFLCKTGHHRIALEDRFLQESVPGSAKAMDAARFARNLVPDRAELDWFTLRSRGRGNLAARLADTNAPQALLVTGKSLRLTLSLLREHDREPGRNISLICSGNPSTDNGISAVSHAPVELIRQAYWLLASYLANAANPLVTARLGMTLTPPTLRITPSTRRDLVGSPMHWEGSELFPDDLGRDLPELKLPWPASRRERIARARELQRAVYDDLPDTKDFHRIDLKSCLNEPYSRPVRGFGHAPLRHLPTGRVTLLGVPFEIVDDRKGKASACLVMRSSRRRRSAGRDLPAKVRIPVRRRASDIFFLHGCAHSLHHQRFGAYTLVFEDGGVAGLPLVSRGRAPGIDEDDPAVIHTPLTPAAKRAGVNIQDHYHDYPQFQEPDAKCLLLTGPDGDPYHHQTYLYTLRWRNPRPNIPIKELVVESDPECLTTLGLFAVTGLSQERP